MLVSNIKNGEFIAESDRDFELINANNCEIHYIKLLFAIITGNWNINYKFINDTFLYIRKMEKKYHKIMKNDKLFLYQYFKVLLPYYEKYNLEYIDIYELNHS